MVIKGVNIDNATTQQDIRIKDGIFVAIQDNIQPESNEQVIDYNGKLLLPPIVESHVHLDTCLTAGQPKWNESGTLFEGIQVWSMRKQTLTREDIRSRVSKAIRLYAANGVQHIRTHVDTTDSSLLAIEVLLQLKDELKDCVDIQIVAFPQEGILSYPKGKELLEQAIKLGVDCVGAIPHYEYTREYGVESLNHCIELACKYNVLVDVHCDEIDDEQSRFLETLATRALESGLKDKVTASHTTAMHSYNNAYTYKLFNLLNKSGINFVSNPLVNTTIGGLTDTYPRRRGVTRVPELLHNGNNVSFGHDDLFDPWYPLGTANMIDVVHMGLHVCQMMGYKDILNSYQLITYNAAKTLNLSNYGIKVGNPANCIILDANDFYNALNSRANILASYRYGKLIASTQPKCSQVMF
jgi:cytosine deaminase